MGTSSIRALVPVWAPPVLAAPPVPRHWYQYGRHQCTAGPRSRSRPRSRPGDGLPVPRRAFFWLVSLLLSSLIWFIAVKASDPRDEALQRGLLIFGVMFSVLLQEAFRFLYYKLLRYRGRGGGTGTPGQSLAPDPVAVAAAGRAAALRHAGRGWQSSVLQSPGLSSLQSLLLFFFFCLGFFLHPLCCFFVFFFLGVFSKKK